MALLQATHSNKLLCALCLLPRPRIAPSDVIALFAKRVLRPVIPTTVVNGTSLLISTSHDFFGASFAWKLVHFSSLLYAQRRQRREQYKIKAADRLRRLHASKGASPEEREKLQFMKECLGRCKSFSRVLERFSIVSERKQTATIMCERACREEKGEIEQRSSCGATRSATYASRVG